MRVVDAQEPAQRLLVGLAGNRLGAVDVAELATTEPYGLGVELGHLVGAQGVAQKCEAVLGVEPSKVTAGLGENGVPALVVRWLASVVMAGSSSGREHQRLARAPLRQCPTPTD